MASRVASRVAPLAPPSACPPCRPAVNVSRRRRTPWGGAGRADRHTRGGKKFIRPSRQRSGSHAQRAEFYVCLTIEERRGRRGRRGRLTGTGTAQRTQRARPIRGRDLSGLGPRQTKEGDCWHTAGPACAACAAACALSASAPPCWPRPGPASQHARLSYLPPPWGSQVWLPKRSLTHTIRTKFKIKIFQKNFKIFLIFCFFFCNF